MRILIWLGVGLLGFLLFALVAIVRPDSDRRRALAEFTQPDSHFVTLADGTRVHVRISGKPDGVPLVLLHGFASSAWAWDGWTASLSPDYRLIRIDLPGHGLTFVAAGGGPTPLSADFLAKTLDALHVERAVIGGNSMGGALAARFAATYPARTLALILVDAPAPRSGPPSRVRALARAWYAPLARFAFRWAGGRLVMRWSLSMGVADGSRITSAEVHRVDVFWRLHRGEILRAAPAAMGADPIEPARITAPTLILQGEKDRLVPRADADLWARSVQRAQLVLLSGLGHTPHEEAPAATAAAVRDFLVKHHLANAASDPANGGLAGGE